jgi:hypothetical protein
MSQKKSTSVLPPLAGSAGHGRTTGSHLGAATTMGGARGGRGGSTGRGTRWLGRGAWPRWVVARDEGRLPMERGALGRRAGCG